MLLQGFLRSATAPRLALLAAALAGPLIASCRVPLVAPSGSALVLIASTNVLAVNGSAEVTAVVLEGAQSGDAAGETLAGIGTPVHDGTVVTFTTSLGRIVPSEATTIAGRATVRLFGDGRSGTAKITAFSGAATNTLDVDIGAAGATRIAVTASPQSLPFTGGSSTVSARVEDQQGNGIGGIVVSFSTTKGTLSSTAVTTNDQGFAQATLTTTAEATVTVTAGGSATALTGTVLVTLKPAATINITPPTSAMLGVSASMTVTPGTTATITDVTLDFGDGSAPFQMGRLTAATTVSHFFRRSGESTVTARVSDADGALTTVSTRVAVAPLTVTASMSPAATATTPKVGDTVTFTVTPQNAGAVIDHCQWDFGDGVSQSSDTTTITHAYGSPGTKVVSVLVFPYGSNEAKNVLIVVDVKP